MACLIVPWFLRYWMILIHYQIMTKQKWKWTKGAETTQSQLQYFRKLHLHYVVSRYNYQYDHGISFSLSQWLWSSIEHRCSRSLWQNENIIQSSPKERNPVPLLETRMPSAFSINIIIEPAWLLHFVAMNRKVKPGGLGLSSYLHTCRWDWETDLRYTMHSV